FSDAEENLRPLSLHLQGRQERDTGSGSRGSIVAKGGCDAQGGFLRDRCRSLGVCREALAGGAAERSLQGIPEYGAWASSGVPVSVQEGASGTCLSGVDGDLRAGFGVGAG